MSISQVSLFKALPTSQEKPLIEEQMAPIAEKEPISEDTVSSEADTAIKEREDLENRTAQALWNLTQIQESLPVASAIGALCLASSDFRMGLCTGTAIYCSRKLLMSSMGNSETETEEEKKLDDGDLKYISQLDWGNTVLTTAVYEELMYRGAVQGAFSLAFSNLFYLISDSDEAQRAASITAIVCASVVFGLQHLDTGHSKSKEQSISAAIGSIPYGFLREKFGLISAIGAHIANNFLALRSMAESVNSSIKEEEGVEKKETE